MSASLCDIQLTRITFILLLYGAAGTGSGLCVSKETRVATDARDSNETLERGKGKREREKGKQKTNSLLPLSPLPCSSHLATNDR